MNLVLYSVIPTSLVIATALIAAASMRSRSAALRHWVLSVAAVCAALVPLLASIVPGWHISFDPASSRRAEVAAAQIIAVQAASASGGRAGVEDVPHPATPPESRITARRIIAPLWISGIIVSLAVLIVGLGRLAAVSARARRVREAWVPLADEIARVYGLGRPVQFLETDDPGLLATWGAVRPKVVMPTAARAWTPHRVRVVLGHELAHVQRSDWAVHIFAELLRSVYWFNPLLWILCRQLRRESERACDDAVLNMGIEGREYAAQLIDLAQALVSARRDWLPASAIVGPSHLERRITAMLNARLNRTPLTRSARLAAAIALLTVTVPIAGFGAQTFGTVSGTISDQFGGLIPNTTVRLSNDVSQVKHEVKSDATGHFQFVGLTSADYLLEVEAMGFAPVRDRVALAAGQTLLRNLVLQVGSLQETITVTDQASSTPASQTRERPRPATIPSKACTPSSVGGRIMPPTKIYDVKPRFPQSLHDANGTAQIDLEARIGTDGSVKEVRTAGTVDPDVESAAKTAVSQWLFTPTLLNCIPIEVNIKTRVYFGQP